MLPRLLPARGQVAGEAGKKEKRGGKRRIVVDEQDLEKLKEGHMDDNNKAAGLAGGVGLGAAIRGDADYRAGPRVGREKS